MNTSHYSGTLRMKACSYYAHISLQRKRLLILPGHILHRKSPDPFLIYLPLPICRSSALALSTTRSAELVDCEESKRQQWTARLPKVSQ